MQVPVPRQTDEGCQGEKTEVSLQTPGRTPSPPCSQVRLQPLVELHRILLQGEHANLGDRATGSQAGQRPDEDGMTLEVLQPGPRHEPAETFLRAYV